jgi:heme exporter protein C
MSSASTLSLSDRFWRWFHGFGSPARFDRFAQKALPWFSWSAGILLLIGLVGGLVFAPADYQQGESFRIIYVHVPAAWMSLFTYVVMATAGAITLIWRMKLADAVSRASAPLGASFTALALITGSLWGKPMWGTYWVWDGRLTSFLILLFLYLGYIALVNAIVDRRTASRAGAVLALVGVINLPIIHFSVEWWNTLHQGATVTKLDAPSIDTRMLIPLLVMFFGFQLYYFAVMLLRVRNELLDTERRTQWVADLLTKEVPNTP